MLSQKYKREFLRIDRNYELQSIMHKIVSKEEEIGITVIKWDTENVEDFLKDLKSISPGFVNRSFTFLRNFVSFIGSKEKIEVPEYKLEFGKLYDFIDYNKLLSTIITYKQYRHIRDQFRLNLRDKVIFELAWNLLTKEEIKYLKNEDIKFSKSKETGLEIVLLKISDTKVIRIEDPETVINISKCMREGHFYVESKDNRNKMNKLKDTPYLIRATTNGPKKVPKPGEVLDESIANPGQSLKDAFESLNITCPGIDDINMITLESIRRSKLIYLLAPQNEKYFDRQLIMTMLDAGNIESNLYWLKKVARIKYNQMKGE